LIGKSCWQNKITLWGPNEALIYRSIESCKKSATHINVGRLHTMYIYLYSTDLLDADLKKNIFIGQEISIRQSIELDVFDIELLSCCISAGALFKHASTYITKKISLDSFTVCEKYWRNSWKFDFTWFLFPKRNVNSRAMDTHVRVVNSAVSPTNNQISTV
jgi:hypothetical protein